MPENITIIDSDNYAASGIETLFFPGGEPHIKVPIFKEKLFLFLKLRNWNDVGFAALLIDALNRQDSVIYFYTFIPYFPGARQDRVSDGKSALTLQIIGSMLCPKYKYYIAVFDAHSQHIFEYTNSINYLPINLNIPLKDNVVGIISPDKGAVERATLFKNKFYPEAELILCGKNRNPTTGQLSGYVMPPLTKEGHYIIVDDICDGGGTFNLLTTEFEKNVIANNSTLELFVSHGIFSKGLEALSPKISHITTTNSWCEFKNTERLTVLSLEPLFDKIIKNTIN